MLKVKALDHLNFTVKNFKETIDFYQEIFGFEVLEEGFYSNGKPCKIIGLKGKFAFCLGEDKELVVGGSFNHFGLNVENFDEVIELLDSKNVSYQYGGVVNYGVSRSIYTNDPSGHEIEISEVTVGGL